LSGQGKEATELQQRLMDVLTTSYSYFYREEDHFQVLTDLLGAGKLPLQPEGFAGLVRRLCRRPGSVYPGHEPGYGCQAG
jgi:hypothetical protein